MHNNERNIAFKEREIRNSIKEFFKKDGFPINLHAEVELQIFILSYIDRLVEIRRISNEEYTKEIKLLFENSANNLKFLNSKNFSKENDLIQFIKNRIQSYKAEISLASQGETYGVFDNTIFYFFHAPLSDSKPSFTRRPSRDMESMIFTILDLIFERIDRYFPIQKLEDQNYSEDSLGINKASELIQSLVVEFTQKLGFDYKALTEYGEIESRNYFRLIVILEINRNKIHDYWSNTIGKIQVNMYKDLENHISKENFQHYFNRRLEYLAKEVGHCILPGFEDTTNPLTYYFLYINPLEKLNYAEVVESEINFRSKIKTITREFDDRLMRILKK